MKYTLLLLALTVATSYADEHKPIKLYTIMLGADVMLQDPFGAILVNEGGENSPSARYILGIQSTGEIVETKDPKIFADALAKLPQKSSIVMYDSCSIPRSLGLSEEVIHGFKRMIKDAGHLVPEDARRITCYCEAIAK